MQALLKHRGFDDPNFSGCAELALSSRRQAAKKANDRTIMSASSGIDQRGSATIA
jgi:hypothetical protein